MEISHHHRLSPHTLAQRRFPSDMLNAVVDNETGELM